MGSAPRLYAISDGQQSTADLVAAAVAAAQAGLPALQLRHKQLDTSSLYDLATRLSSALAAFDCGLYINER